MVGLLRVVGGPTPSSAIFYGALSVHLGAFLLLRASPLIVQSPVLQVLVVALGLSTALWGTVAARVQADIKGALAYASLTQVGLIVAEIGLGWRLIPLAHLVGNACLRTLQLLRAPSLLHDYHQIENAIGGQMEPQLGGPWVRRFPRGAVVSLYRLGYERGWFEHLAGRLFLDPARRVLLSLERLERRWVAWLSGSADAPGEWPHRDPFDPTR